MQRTYIAIDLKSFYASVECVERGLDPLDANLVVADITRTEKTICLAVSPSLKSHGTGGRPRLFEVVQRVREVNRQRRRDAGRWLTGKSISAKELSEHPEMELDYIVAPPRMSHYIDYSTRIYKIYLKYIAPEDIQVYSIDEVLIDVTSYLATAGMTAHEMVMTMIRDVLKNTGITATAGIGTNLYLAKIAMDIVAKKMPPDKDGVRIAELDEASYRRQLWDHVPLTDFWRVGRGIAGKLADYGIITMGQIARASLTNESMLFKLFGVNAELLIDHAWGWEPVTMEQVKAYRPESSSISSGQVLTTGYDNHKALVVTMEMAEGVALDLVEKHMVTDQLVLTIGYDAENLKDEELSANYHGEIHIDRYGRRVPKSSRGTENIASGHTSSSNIIRDAAERLFRRISNPQVLIRRLTLSANHLIDERKVNNSSRSRQLDLFADYAVDDDHPKEGQGSLGKERRLMEAVIALKRKFGKNALLKGLDYEEGATARERNSQIGGHKA